MRGAGANMDGEGGCSGLQCALIHGELQGLCRFPGGNGGELRGFEPAIFLDLVAGHGRQWRFGAHDNDGLELTLDFPGFTPDKKFTDIKFRHVIAFPLDTAG